MCKFMHIGEAALAIFLRRGSWMAVQLARKIFGLPEEPFAPRSAPPAEAGSSPVNSGARMSKLRCILVVMAALALSLSFAVPVEDDPETPYDESEALPYESNPVFSIMLEESARAVQLLTTFAFPLHFHPTAKRNEILAKQSARTPHPISGSLTILDHSLRC
jgi:hypothetical protein